MDQLRTWAARVVAPLAFILAAAVLVIVVDRALDDGGSGDAATVAATEPSVSVPVTTEPIVTDVTDTVPEGAREFYRVKAGDTLEAIAGRFDTTVERLLQLNPGVDPLALSPGQRIRVA